MNISTMNGVEGFHIEIIKNQNNKKTPPQVSTLKGRPELSG